MLRDHSPGQLCEHGYDFPHTWMDDGAMQDPCPGGAPVENERTEWCKTHREIAHNDGRCHVGAFNRVVAVELGEDEGAECRIVPALIVEASDG